MVTYPLLSTIRAPSVPHDKRRLHSITTSIRENNWRGRPLLGERLPDGRIQAWTGAYRIHGARRAKLITVPVLHINREAAIRHLKRCGFHVGDVVLLCLPDSWQDRDRMQFLRDAGDSFGAAALAEEIRAAEREARVHGTPQGAHGGWRL